VHEAVLVVALGALDRLSGRRHRDAAALEVGRDHPTNLEDMLVAPLIGPVADRAGAGAQPKNFCQNFYPAEVT